MIRLAAAAVIAVIANAIGLVVAAQVLDDMALGVAGFVIAVAIYSVVAVVVEPLLRQIAIKHTPALLGSTALLATLVSLLLTSVLSNSLSIRGATTWVLATVIVWAVGLAARMLLPLVIFKKVLEEHRSRPD